MAADPPPSMLDRQALSVVLKRGALCSERDPCSAHPPAGCLPVGWGLCFSRAVGPSATWGCAPGGLEAFPMTRSRLEKPGGCPGHSQNPLGPESHPLCGGDLSRLWSLRIQVSGPGDHRGLCPAGRVSLSILPVLGNTVSGDFLPSGLLLNYYMSLTDKMLGFLTHSRVSLLPLLPVEQTSTGIMRGLVR